MSIETYVRELMSRTYSKLRTHKKNQLQMELRMIKREATKERVESARDEVCLAASASKLTFCEPVGISLLNQTKQTKIDLLIFYFWPY